MALTQINSEGIKDSEVKTIDIADQAVDLTKLPHGDGTSDGKYLRSNNGADPTWETVSQYSTPLSQRGDILFRDGSGDARLAKGTDGQFLKIGANDPVWADVPAGTPTGGGTDKVFWVNENSIDTSYTIPDGKNAGTFGPVTIADGVTVEVGDEETWTII